MTRVRTEAGDVVADEIGALLRRLARQASSRPASRGLAPYVGGGVAEGYRLPVAVQSRTVVDPTFATRDLERLAEVDRTPSACRGIDAVWASAVRGRFHLLLIEQAYTVPGVVTDGGMRLERVHDPEAPGAPDDAVDERTEIVRRSDGAVRFVPTDTLDGGVAALLRGAA